MTQARSVRSSSRPWQAVPYWALLLILGAAFLVSPPPSPAWAVQPDEMLEDPALEARARDLSQGLRCVVCQNESIDESNAELAHDMRVRVRELLTEGKSDQQIMDFMVARYGEYVLLKPVFRPGTYVLWFGPAILMAVGLFVMMRYFRTRRADAAVGAPMGTAPADVAPEEDPAPPPLSTEEQARLAKLMKDDTP
ncbi:MAG: cytochrome c-type biogenesis protein [Rhodospirillaceae bacterium]